MLSKALLAAAKAVEPVYVENVFQTWLYTGNGSTQTITNGIDLAGEGGLVWLKQRSGGGGSERHGLFDTERGVSNVLVSNSTDAETFPLSGVSAFNSNGFNLGSQVRYNASSQTFASWTFRKAEKFFDVVTYTGNGTTGRSIAHALGSAPGMIIVKRTDSSSNWKVFHRSGNVTLLLNSTTEADSATALANGFLGTTGTTSFETYAFGGNIADVNASGGTYVAYLFAHDAGGFGDSGDESVVKCGSYTGNGSTSGPTIDLGWEPQWLLVKNATSGGNNWVLIDNMRGFSVTGNQWLYPNDSAAEATAGLPVAPLATGFQPRNSGTFVNESGSTYIYIAIRRGPMKTPTVGTEVFSQVARTGTGSAVTITGTGFAPDALIYKSRSNAVAPSWQTRLQGGSPRLASSSTAAESADNELDFGATMDGIRVLTGDGVINFSSWTYINYFLRRAPGFFDVVALTGTNSATAYSHNLGVAPEMIIVKKRSGTSDWLVYQAGYPTPTTNQGALNLTGGSYANNNFPTAPTSTQFTLHVFDTGTYIAYLFASCPGVSKVGSYTGTGTTFNIDCGFTAGARFVLIKRTDSTGDWYVWDTARGIISGNDPYLLLNSTAAEVTSTDYIDPLSSGFQITSTAPAAINANGGSFIFLAIA